MHTLLVHADAVTGAGPLQHKGFGEGHRPWASTWRQQGEGALTFCFTFRKSSTRNRLQRWMTYSLCQAERRQRRTQHRTGVAWGLAGAHESDEPAAAAWTRKH